MEMNMSIRVLLQYVKQIVSVLDEDTVKQHIEIFMMKLNDEKNLDESLDEKLKKAILQKIRNY